MLSTLCLTCWQPEYVAVKVSRCCHMVFAVAVTHITYRSLSLHPSTAVHATAPSLRPQLRVIYVPRCLCLALPSRVCEVGLFVSCLLVQCLSNSSGLLQHVIVGVSAVYAGATVA